jgi:hypothetical protein
MTRATRTTFTLTGLLLGTFASVSDAQERPYFVTYNDTLQKRGELEVSLLSTIGQPKDESARYFAPWIEIEYGVTKRWTTELYIEGVSIHDDASAFTGWRLENRFRPFEGNHLINPVLYIEYESINEGSRIQKEIVGEGSFPSEPIRMLRHEHAHELEGRLILSKQVAAWDVAGNVIAEKNLSESEGVEFGYAAAVSRRIGRLVAGMEAYGGLGATIAEPAQTRHFVAPTVAWRLTRASMLKASVGFGVTNTSERYLVRFGYSIDAW